MSSDRFGELTMYKASCLRVPKNLGEKAIALARRLSLLNKGLRVQQEGSYLLIPLVHAPLPLEIKELEGSLQEFEVSLHSFPERVEHPEKLIEVLESKLPPHLLASLPHAMDFVGDIAIVEVPPELEGYERMLGEAILATHKRVHTVLAKAGAVGGIYRVRELRVIAGEEKTETVHREHGCMYHVDLTKAYFSPRLSYEHLRVASQVKEGETVVDMFAGVGPFSVLTAKKHERVHVYAVDLNPDAIGLLERNIVVNRVEGKVIAVLGEVRQVVRERLRGVADRAIMNLPERAIEYVDVACEAVKPEGGVIHYYGFESSSEPSETAKNRLVEAVKGNGRRVDRVLLTRIVRATAPFTWQVAVDAEIR